MRTSEIRRYSAGLAIVALLVLAACGGTTTGSGNGTPGSTPSGTAKPKPSTLPAVTTAYCQSLVTVDEANQIMAPSPSVTTIQADQSGDLGTCLYQDDSGTNDLEISLQVYSGPTPIPQSYILQNLTALSSAPGFKLDANTTVSGVGDQAEFLSASFSDTGINGAYQIFYVLYGSVLFACDTSTVNGIGATGSQSQLQQCAQLVVSRL
jgi:hypothetical protein